MFNVKSYLKIQSFKDIQIRKSLQLMFENSWQGKILLILKSRLIVEKMYDKLVHYNHPVFSLWSNPRLQRRGIFTMRELYGIQK